MARRRRILFYGDGASGSHLSLLEGGDVRTVVLQSDPRDAAPRSLHRPAVAALPRRRRGVAPGGFLAVADADSPADSSPGAADARDLPARRRPRPEAGQRSSRGQVGSCEAAGSAGNGAPDSAIPRARAP